jgi:hypothetical protein
MISIYLLPLPDGKTDTELEGTLHSFAAELQLSLHFHILSHSTILPYHSLNLRDMGSPPKWWLLGCPIGRWSGSPSASWGRSEFEPRFLPVWWVVLPSPHWFLSLTGFHCATETLTPTPQEDESPSRSSCPLVPGRISSWQSRGRHPGDKGGDNSPSLCSQVISPQEMLLEFASWDTGLLRQLAGSKVLLCQHRLSGLLSTDWAWEQRGLTLYILSSRLQKQKARSNPYMVIFNFIATLP